MATGDRTSKSSASIPPGPAKRWAFIAPITVRNITVDEAYASTRQQARQSSQDTESETNPAKMLNSKLEVFLTRTAAKGEQQLAAISLLSPERASALVELVDEALRVFDQLRHQLNVLCSADSHAQRR